MKKFNIIFVTFIFLWYVTYLYIDINIKLHSFYWLAYQLFALLVMVTGLIFIKIREKESSPWAIFFWRFFTL